MQAARKKSGRREEGFTLVEMMLATVVILVGLVAVAQLVPASVLLNSANRMDSTSLVIAQRQMDLLLQQPLASTSYTDVTGLACSPGDTCNLGDPTQPNVVVGSPVVSSGSTLLVNFGAATQAGYCFSTPWVDPNDPSGASFDIRWAVIITGNGSTVRGKRFIVVSGSLAGTGSSRRLRWIRRCANESAQWPAWRPGWILADRDDDRSGHFSADQRSGFFTAWGRAKALRDGIRSSQRLSGGAAWSRPNRTGRERRGLSAAESVHFWAGNAAGQYLCFLAGRLDSELSLHSMPGGDYVRHYSDGNRHHHRDVCFGSGLSQQRSFLDSLSISRHDAQSRDYLQIQHGSRRGHKRGRNHGSLRPECHEQRIRGANRPISNVLSFHVSKRGAGADFYLYLRHAKRPRAGLLDGLRHGQFASERARRGDHAYCYGSRA